MNWFGKAILVATVLLGGALRVQAQDDAELEALLQAERDEAARSLRHGDLRGAKRILGELLDEEPGDALSRELLARCHLEEGDLAAALRDAEKARGDARTDEARRTTARTLAELELYRGEAQRAVAAMRSVEALLAPGSDARDAWALGHALLEAGQRAEARIVLDKGANSRRDAPWDQLLAKARCERALGQLERASITLVAADDATRRAGDVEADVLVELAGVCFEADGEVDPDDLGRARDAPGPFLKQALDVHPSHEGALIGLFALHRFNWKRQSRPAHEFLDELLAARPQSVPGLVAGAAADLDDGQLVTARQRLATLRTLAPHRRDVRTLEAALAWIEHRRDDCAAVLAELAKEDPVDGRPEREVGRILCELYRFAEGLPFLQRAVEREPESHEAWTQLGRALANTGDEQAGLEALRTAKERAAGRQNAWRFNTTLVLERMLGTYDHFQSGELSFAWSKNAAAVLAVYLVPFYGQAREELAARYGFTPGPVKIEVFERHRDFSVRSTGFEGFPALGVCFGPVVTAVSPLSELRGTFSWARTSFHEFTHVVHLGLSHNRCPRWITEGLATWEEVARNPAWTRNMRRELLDAYANGNLIGVRDLNRAFRGPRILFGYYQGGLLCNMLVARHGFQPMIRLLEAFDRGLDLDQALKEVFATTPEALDAEFQDYVRAETKDLALEPRWSPDTRARLTFELGAEPPKDQGERVKWTNDVCTLAWAQWQEGLRVDAEQALRRLSRAGIELPRASFLSAEIALSAGANEKARELWERGIAAGGEDYRVRMALGKLELAGGELECARDHFLAAEKAFPGFDDREFSAELHLAQVYERLGSEEDAMRARERWLAFNAGELEQRLEVAQWHAAARRFEDAARYYQEANEVDPFLRELHAAWGNALMELGHHEEALREFEVALLVPPELDGRAKGPPTTSEKAELLGRAALMLVELGRLAEAGERASAALELDPTQAFAKEARERLQ